MIQLGPEVANIDFNCSVTNACHRFLHNAEVTVLPCGLVHVRPEHMSLGYVEFTVPASAVKEIVWNPFGKVIDYGPKTVARETDGPIVEAIQSSACDVIEAIRVAERHIQGDYT